ncbi:MAG: hypothetical protein V3V92_04025 [Candidatus Hydrothermarchaeales archaeon]
MEEKEIEEEEAEKKIRGSKNAQIVATLILFFATYIVIGRYPVISISEIVIWLISAALWTHFMLK